jgi:hypothetical protein
MFRGVNEQPQSCGREARSSHLALGQQRLACRVPQLFERAIERRVRSVDERWQRAFSVRLGACGGYLLSGERLAARIGEQAFGGPADVADMETDRRRAAGTFPDRAGRHSRREPRSSFTCRNECATGITYGSNPGTGPRCQTSVVAMSTIVFQSSLRRSSGRIAWLRPNRAHREGGLRSNSSLRGN